MLKTKWEYQDSVYHMRCFFENKGDLLPMHMHREESFHNIKVLRGKVKVTGILWDGEIIIEPGHEIELTMDQCLNHELEALEDKTETIHQYTGHHRHMHFNLLRDQDKVLY